MIHDADIARDALMEWILHESGQPVLLAAAWQRLLTRTPVAVVAPRHKVNRYCKHGHEMTDANVYIHEGKRHCRPCRTETARRHRQ